MSLALLESDRITWTGMSDSGQPDAISASGFARLLDRLHPDPDEAAHEYERLRHRLVKFFDWRGLSSPDECADETLDRLARKLEDTSVLDVQKYVYGIARLVALERRRGPAFTSLDDAPVAVAAPAAEPDSPLQECFDRCLAELPEDGQRLLLRYYEGERQTKIANRRRLAAELNLSDNALRSRVQRLRDTLERCMQACAPTPAHVGR